MTNIFGVPQRPGAQPSAVSEDEEREGRRWLIAAILVIIVVRMFWAQVFVVPSESMEPTLQVGDRMLVSPVVSTLAGIEHGDVVVFSGSGSWDLPPRDGLPRTWATVADALALPGGTKKLVKRVIAVGGDHVVCCDKNRQILLNGQPLKEPYLYPGNYPSLRKFDVVVPQGRLWVLGDHRSESADSRYHPAAPGGGTIPVSAVIGRVEFLVWPMSRFGQDVAWRY